MLKTFVLVHGAWVGEWCYDPIIPLLKDKGHSAFAVSLTGFGKKRHLHSSNITILDHIQDVIEFVESRDVRDFVLVGHSYGGGVITGAWDHLRERIVEVFYLDAATPENGESHHDNMLKYDETGSLNMSGGSFIKQGVQFRPFPLESLRKRDPEKAVFTQDKVIPFPIKCATTPIKLKNGPLPADIPKTFVLCLKNKSYHHKQAEMIQADKSWRYFELDTYHDCMWEDPEGLVEILAG
ncbi:MAG: alpha/beta fold hydrolase [Anaerolineae bacterium]